jgi:hypothetical protein
MKNLRYTPPGPISDRTFKEGKIAASRDVKVSEQFLDLLIAAQAFDKKRRYIAEYNVLAVGKDTRNGKQIVFTVQRLTDLYYGVRDLESYAFGQYDRWMEEVDRKSSYFDLNFFRVVLITDKTKKNALDELRRKRSEAQARGRLEAQRERELQKREAAQKKARETIAENKRRIAAGLPKLKRKH